MDQNERREIRERCEAAKIHPIGNAYATHGEYEREITALLDALDEMERKIAIALKTCPSGGNDGYITPRPCQLVNCEECHAEHEATMDGIKAERDRYKARCEALETDLINASMNLRIMTMRCEALEKALRTVSDMCDTCIGRDKEGFIEPCKSCRCVTGLGDSYNWQFDEARFTGEKDGAE